MINLINEEKDKWRTLFQGADATISSVEALVYYSTFASISKPVLVRCSDGFDYVVKGQMQGQQWMDRALVADRIVGSIGFILGAPTPEIGFINLDPQLIDGNAGMKHLLPGVCHASRHIKDVSPDRETFGHFDFSENRLRFARIAILYGLAFGNDHQFLYALQEPHTVYSHDHGHFFPGGPNWSIASLQGAPDAESDLGTVSACALTQDELAIAASSLGNLTNSSLLQVIAQIPPSWNFSLDEQIEVAMYLEKRRNQLAQKFSITIQPD